MQFWSVSDLKITTEIKILIHIIMPNLKDKLMDLMLPALIVAFYFRALIHFTFISLFITHALLCNEPGKYFIFIICMPEIYLHYVDL